MGNKAPHFIESSTFNFKYMWPNPHHIPHEEYQENLHTTTVSEGSDSFANTDWSPGPSSPPPNFNSLSPQPPHFHLADEEQQDELIDQTINQTISYVDNRITRGCSIAEELAQVLTEIQMAQAQNLDHFIFREGGLTYCQLQHLDQLVNPDIHV